MSISRRSFMRAGLAGAALAAIPFPLWLKQQAFAQGTLPIRYDAASAAGKRNLASLAKAVTAMKQLPASDPRSWTWQWYTHWIGGPQNLVNKQPTIDKIFPNPADPGRSLAQEMWDMCQSHGAPNDSVYHFLPWHRMYVYFFEAVVRELSGDSAFTLPYWNYLNANQRAIPAEFRMPNDKVFASLYRDNRNAGINAGKGLPAKDLPNTSLSLPTFLDQNGVDDSGFSNNLNDILHGNVHVDVGNTTNMGVIPYAANDPIFWMHHCNVDRIWASWNKGGGSNPTDAEWLSKQFVFVDGKGQRVVCTTGDFTSIDKLYAFATYEPAPIPKSSEKALLAATNRSLTALASSGGGKVPLGPGTTRVSLQAETSGRSNALTATPGGGRTYLVLSDRAMTVPPGVIYDIYVHAASKTATESDWVGGLNFFCVLTEEHQGHRSGYSLDVTGKIKGDPANLVVSIKPRGVPAADAGTTIGTIRLVTL